MQPSLPCQLPVGLEGGMCQEEVAVQLSLPLRSVVLAVVVGAVSGGKESWKSGWLGIVVQMTCLDGLIRCEGLSDRHRYTLASSSLLILCFQISMIWKKVWTLYAIIIHSRDLTH